MKRPHHTGMVAGVGTAVGAVILSMGLLSGCAPGTICDKDEYQQQCLTGGAGGTGTGGSSGGSTGGMPSAPTGGTNGSTGGTGGSKSPACKLWTTKEEVAEKLVVAKCSMPGETGCHAVAFAPKFTNPGEAVMALLDKAPTLYCRTDKLINKADPAKSIIVSKVRGPGPQMSCPSGGMNNGGAKMPFTPKPALSDDEADCLEWWAYEVSK